MGKNVRSVKQSEVLNTGDAIQTLGDTNILDKGQNSNIGR